MRIIAGDYKGRKIFEPLDKETRPLKDLFLIFLNILKIQKFQ